MRKKQVAVVVVLMVLCVLVGVCMDSAAIADALAPVGDGLSNFTHHLNTIQ